MVAATKSLSPRAQAIADRRALTNAERESTFTVAKDAYLTGRTDDAEAVIAASRKGLTKTQYKQIATLLVAQGRRDEAMTLLTGAIGEQNAKRELAPTPKATVGDILRCSWGYDQTNVDYYQVVALVGVSSVRIRKIGKRCVRQTQGTDYVMAVRDSFVDDGMTEKRAYHDDSPGYGPTGTLHRIQKTHDGDRYSIRISSYSWAYPWDGTEDYETAWGYGH